MAQLFTKTLISKMPRTRDISNDSLRDFSVKIYTKISYNNTYYLVASMEPTNGDIIFLCYCIDTVNPSSGRWQYIAHSQFMGMINNMGIPLKRDIYFERCTLKELIYMDRLYV